jgi:hypothetical protein
MSVICTAALRTMKYNVTNANARYALTKLQPWLDQYTQRDSNPMESVFAQTRDQSIYNDANQERNEEVKRPIRPDKSPQEKARGLVYILATRLRPYRK